MFVVQCSTEHSSQNSHEERLFIDAPSGQRITPHKHRMTEYMDKVDVQRCKPDYTQEYNFLIEELIPKMLQCLIQDEFASTKMLHYLLSENRQTAIRHPNSCKVVLFLNGLLYLCPPRIRGRDTTWTEITLDSCMLICDRLVNQSRLGKDSLVTNRLRIIKVNLFGLMGN